MRFAIGVCLVLMYSCLSFADASLGRHISVNAQGEVKVEPDQAKVSIRVSVKENSSLKAKALADQRFNAFYQTIKKELAILDEDIIASNIVTQPDYDYTRSGRKLLGYRATRNVEITLKNLDDLNQLLDIALKNQLDEIQNINLGSSKKVEIKAKAREIAVQNAIKKASHLALQFGAKLGPVYSVKSQDFDEFRPVRYNRTMALQESASSDSGQYIQESITFKASVDVVFDLLVDETGSK